MTLVLSDLLVERGTLTRQLSTRVSRSMPSAVAEYERPGHAWTVAERCAADVWFVRYVHRATHDRMPFARRMCLGLTMFERVAQVASAAQVLSLEQVHGDAPTLEQRLEERTYAQMHLTTTGLTLQVNRDNFDCLMRFVEGNAQQISAPASKPPSGILGGLDAQAHRCTEFNPTLKFGVPEGSAPEFCLTAHIPRVLVWCFWG